MSAEPALFLHANKEVEIVDHTGKSIGELDEIDLDNGIFYEDKVAKGLGMIIRMCYLFSINMVATLVYLHFFVQYLL